MKEQKNKFIAKFIRKPYDDYCFATQKQLKTEQCLQLTYIGKPKDDNKIYSYYAGKIKKLNAKYRTILFYGVPIKLSKQQFYVLYILITDGNIRSDDYAELSETLYGKIMKQNAVDGNLKSFISDFILKIDNTITRCRDNTYFKDMPKEQIKHIIKMLISYEKSFRGYIIKTSYKLESSEKISEIEAL